MKKSGWTLLMFIFIGGLLGGVLGEILRVFTPPGTIQNIFARTVAPGLDPPFTVDLVLIKITIGFILKMNLLTLLGMFLGIYLYKNI
ncbi:MAG: DUF4321 domain-containing protein [Nitrospirae bacterium]|jgi:DMSO reductase anchor subunit|nr:DUF4321 domain-containing protein [Nitrospirota bacterium]